MQDLRFAVRALRATPVVTAVAILSLALGIGANTAIFSLINSLLLRSLSVREPGRLAMLVEPAQYNSVPMPLRYAVWDQIRQHSDLFDGAVVWSATSLNIATQGEAQLVDGLIASGSFFDVLGVPAFAGRTFSEIDDAATPGHADAVPVAVISYGYWQRRFGGATDAIGRTLTLEGVTFTIAGVTAQEFSGLEAGRSFDVVVPLGTEPLLHRHESWLDSNNLSSPLRLVVRLRPGSSVGAITSAVRGLQAQIRTATVPQSWPVQARSQYLFTPFTFVGAVDVNWRVRRTFERPLLTMLAAVALVLLVACGNVANLQLARANARRAELSVRRALGASRCRIVRQLLMESVVLSAIGGAIGIAVASWASHALVQQISTDANPVILDLSLDLNVIGFTAALAAVTTLLFGVVPAWHSSRTVELDAFRAQSRQSAGELGGRLSGGLLVAQVALSLVLIVAAGLLGRTFASLVTRDKGFDPRQVLVVNIDSTGSTLRPAERASVYERARHAVGSVPGVSDAALSFATPIVTGPMLSQPIRSVAGGPELRIGQPNTIAALNTVSPGWFRAMGIRILAGRDVAENDRQNTPAVALVNQAFAQKFVSGVNPVGQTITLWLPGPPPSPVEIVGLVSDAVYGTLRNAPPPTLYMPISQLGGPWLPFLASVNVIVHGRFAAGSLSRAVAAAIASVHPGLVLKSHTLDEQLSASLTQERVLAMLSGSFAALALLLAALGLYGVAAYSVSRRRREFGIRMALGAAPSSIARLATHRIAVLVVLGIAAGAGVSAWATRFIGTLLYNLEPRDPQTLAGAAVVLVVVAGLAAWLPARRASRIDPAEVLRES